MISFQEFEISGSTPLREIVSEIRGDNSKSPSNTHFESRVSEIITKVKNEGDAALLELSARYDGASFSTAKSLFVPKDEFDIASESLSKQQKEALRSAHAQIRWLAKSQMRKRYRKCTYRTPLGFTVEESFAPLKRIGGYVPGGLASYPSTVLMICAPAREAGVSDIVLATPPNSSGKVAPALLYAASLCGVSEVIKLGGAQAIASLAYGSESIQKVELIAGPGNQYVTEAKRQVSASGAVLIDALAGPTELLILADRRARPDLVSEDLISQAEHGNKTLIGVVSDSAEFLSRVRDATYEAVSIKRERYEHIRQSCLFSVKARSLDEAVEFAQSFAPEHLELHASNASSFERKLTSAGLILSGEYVPCSATDYIVGTDHILPTGGSASRSSGLSVETFLRRVTVVRSSSASLRRALKPLAELAKLEGLPNHAAAANTRFRRIVEGPRRRKGKQSRQKSKGR